MYIRDRQVFCLFVGGWESLGFLHIHIIFFDFINKDSHGIAHFNQKTELITIEFALHVLDFSIRFTIHHYINIQCSLSYQRVWASKIDGQP